MDREFMTRAIMLAKKAEGCTNPNPMVGAVIVKEGRVISEGYHERIGEFHAERNAILSCKESMEGATIYVTLEPCCHYGKTPPCTEIIIESGIKRVVIGSGDPNPKVAGKGARILREHGIEVIEGFMREECDAINPVFFQYIRNKMPYVALKYAMTADGKIAANSGKSQWITGETARGHVQKLRNYYKGILVGIGTVLQDDPRLTCRMEGGRHPVRIVLDSRLRIPEDCCLCRTAKEVSVIVACTEAEPQKREKLAKLGVTVIVTKSDAGRVDIRDLLRQLGEMEIDGILVEGGSGVNASFVRAGAVNRIYTYIGAQVFGGVNRFTPIGGEGILEVSDSLKLHSPSVQVFDDDVLIRYECERSDGQ